MNHNVFGEILSGRLQLIWRPLQRSGYSSVAYWMWDVYKVQTSLERQERCNHASAHIRQTPDRVDKKGIAVALAVLVGIGVLAEGRDNSAGKDRQSHAAPLQSDLTSNTRQSGTVPHSDHDGDQKSLFEHPPDNSH